MPADTSSETPPTKTFAESPENAAATRDISSASPFGSCFQRFLLAAGAGAYTVKVTLDRTDTTPLDGAFARLRLQFDAGTNPTVEVYDDTVGGTLLQTITGSAGAKVFVFEGVYENGVWNKYDGRLVP